MTHQKHDLREVFKGLRYLVKTAAHWRMLLHDVRVRLRRSAVRRA